MRNIFIPMMGRINTQNRDGGEVRLAKFICWLSTRFQVNIYCPLRQLNVLERQGVSLVRLKVSILKDVFNSECDNLSNFLATYSTRILKVFLFRYPKGIDVIYCPSDFLFDIIPALLCKLCNPKAKLVVCFFLLCKNPFFEISKNRIKIKKPRIGQYIYYLCQGLSVYICKITKAKVLVLNNLDMECLSKRDVDVALVTMGVDIKQYSDVSVDDKIYDAIYFGRLHHQKGIERLIKAWGIVGKNKGYSLGILGGGSDEYKKGLIKIAEENGVANLIKFTGFLDGEKKIAAIKSSKIAVIPSIYESFGMTVIEAGLCGLHVVAFDIPVFKELFSQYITLVSDNDIEAYAASIIDSIMRKSTASNEFIMYCLDLDWDSVFEKEVRIIDG